MSAKAEFPTPERQGGPSPGESLATRCSYLAYQALDLPRLANCRMPICRARTGVEGSADTGVDGTIRDHRVGPQLMKVLVGITQ